MGGSFLFKLSLGLLEIETDMAEMTASKRSSVWHVFLPFFLLSSRCLVFGQEEVPVTFGSRGGFFSPSFLKSPSSSMHTLPLLLQKYIKNPGTEPLGVSPDFRSLLVMQIDRDG
jgi:hypothetical protein